jgi:arylsulfatase A-like enzyme
MNFSAFATSEVFGLTNTGEKVTATGSATATSDISYQDAYNIAKEIANNIASSELQNNINIIEQTIAIINNEDDNNKEYTQTSNIFILMDQLIAYHNLPSWLLEKLPGYQAFSKMGIEFTNIHNNRQMCSPSRATIQTSIINHGIQSNVDQSFQNDYIPHLSYDFETIGKSIKNYNSEIITGYYGKEHLQSELNTDENILPLFNSNTRGAQRGYGYDLCGIFGESRYGTVTDNRTFNTVLNNTTNNVDYIAIDPLSQEKTGYIGALPFLKARLQENSPFHLQIHLTNPHDTEELYQNFTKIPQNGQYQFSVPFLKEQTTDVNLENPYVFNEYFTDAYIKNDNLVTNYFEQTFSEYSTSIDSLPFLESYVGDYVTNSKTNPINEYYYSIYKFIEFLFTIANDEKDIKSWKNLINNYYGLIIEADKYIFKVYKFLKNNNMLKNVSVVISSDHGELMSAHGLKQKGVPFRECVNIPCVVYSSNIPEDLQGTKNNVLGSLLDIAPTIDVLMNIRYKNTNFLGESLIQQNNGKLIPRTNNLPVMHIYNDSMTSVGCLLNETYTKSLFEFNYCFNMIIDYDDVTGKLYKFGRFFNIVELFRYNFIYNKLIPNEIPLSIFDDKQFLKFIILKNETVGPILTNLKLFLNKIYSEYFTFYDAYIKVSNNFKGKNNSNSTELSLFMLIIDNYMKYFLKNQYIIPCVYNDWNTIINQYYPNKWVEPFCYNITDDNNEVKNIFYKKNIDGTFSYNSSNNALFERLNKKLNDLTIKQCMTVDNRFTFLIPEIIYENTVIIFNRFGTNINTYTNDQKLLLISSNYINNYDNVSYPTYNSRQNITDNLQ